MTVTDGTKGTVWPAEWKSGEDPHTGITVRQLTGYNTHSRHLYFTENGWYDDNRKLLFVSDRGNRTNLFSLDMESGEIVQLTDLPGGTDDLSVCLDPAGTRAFFRRGKRVTALDLDTLEETLLYEGPDGFGVGQLSCSADGAWILTALCEDFSDRMRLDLGRGYVGHRELMEARPSSRIIRIPTGGGKAETVFEEKYWIGHVNASPVHANLLTYCHEGPWQRVDHRIWLLDLESGANRKIRERKAPEEMVGHEFWLADGEHIGFHGFRRHGYRENGAAFFGKIRYDNTGLQEVDHSIRSWHAHLHHFSQAVIDGRDRPFMYYWRTENGAFGKPKLLCEHRCSFHVQKVHAHPRFTPDGRNVLFTSDKSGYGQLYLAEIPEDPGALPDADQG